MDTEDPEKIVPFESISNERWIASDVLGIINTFERMLLAMEARLVQKMDGNFQAASERWAAHDRELEASQKRMGERFETLEKNLLVVETALNIHLKNEERDDIIMAARVQPVKQTFGWLWRNWRDILLLAIGLLAAATFISDRIARLFVGA